MHHHVLAPIETARDIVAAEHTEIEAERAAWAAFRARVDQLAPPGAGPIGTDPPVQSSVVHQAAPTLHEQLRTAYRDTVMDVAHYDRVYGESLFEHLTAELGPDIATGFQPHATFTSPFKKRLLAAIDAAHNDCETALDALTTERESLKRAASELRGILTDLTRHSQ